MKGNTVGKVGRVSAALVAFVGVSFCEARAAGFTVLDAAWKEAVILAGVAEISVARPQVVHVGSAAGRPEEPAAEYVAGVSEVRVYSSDGRLPYYLIVQEFLSSIYEQTRSTSLSAYASGRAGSRETWVRDKMGWRVRSRAFSRSASLN